MGICWTDVCCTVARCSLPGVFFFFFKLRSLFFLLLFPLTSLPTDSTHLKLPGQSQLEALVLNILLQMIWDTVLNADPCTPKWCLGSSLFLAWLLHGVPVMKAQSLCFFLCKQQPGLLFLGPAGLLVNSDGLLCWQRLQFHHLRNLKTCISVNVFLLQFLNHGSLMREPFQNTSKDWSLLLGDKFL